MSKKGAIISGIAGLVIGGAAGFFGGGYYIKKKIGNKYDEDLEEMREYYRNKCKVDANEAAKAIISEKIEEEKNDTKESEFEEVPKTFVQKDKEIYENMAHDYTEHHAPAKKPKNKAKVIEAERTIYPISEHQFDNDESFRKETLYYYDGDGVLTDEEDELCNIQSLLGDKEAFLKSFGNREDEAIEITYIRNCEMETDYRVLYDERSYTDVFGVEGGD